MEGIGPDDIRIKELLARLADGRIKEVILATNPDIEGEATASYIARLIRPMRAYGRIRKVARTIADLGEHDQLEVQDVAQAIQLRNLDGQYWR